MKIRNLALVLMFTPLVAFAGKAERDFTANEVNPAIQEAVAAAKTSCGYAIKFDVKFDTFKDVNDLWMVKRFANSVKEGMQAYCTDAGSKTAIAKLKTIEFSKGSNVSFIFKDGKGTAITDNSSYPSWSMITEAVDK